MAALYGDESRLPVFDLHGDGVEEISGHALGANVDGMFSVWNGKGQRLYAISFLRDRNQGGTMSGALPTRSADQG